MKYITIKLTEDQVRELRHTLEQSLFHLGESQRPFVKRILTKLDKALAEAKN